MSGIYIGNYISHGGDVESHLVLNHIHYVGQISQLVRKCHVLFTEIHTGKPVTAGRVHSKVSFLHIILVCTQSVTQGRDILGHSLQLLNVEEQR